MISIVIVAYNSDDTLGDCLASLTKLKDTEVIVVDNNSQDKSAAVATKYKDVKLIKSLKNLGFNGGNQLGYEASLGEIVVFLNPDTQVPADFSERLQKAFSDHPEAGIIGCRINNEDGSLQRTCNRLPTLRSLLFEHSGYHTLFPNSAAYSRYIYRDWDRSSSRYVDAVSGACTSVRRSSLQKIDGLDTAYFLFYEEFDLSQKIFSIGQKVWFESDLIVTHIGSTSTKKSNQDFINATYAKSRDRYLKKWRGSSYLSLFHGLCWLCNKLGGLKSRIQPGLLA